MDKQLTGEKIIALLTEVESGANVSTVCRQHGISHLQYYKWRAQYGGMQAEELQRLHELQNENLRLRRLVVDGQLAIDVLLDRVTELVTQPARKPTSEHSA